MFSLKVIDHKDKELKISQQKNSKIKSKNGLIECKICLVTMKKWKTSVINLFKKLNKMMKIWLKSLRQFNKKSMHQTTKIAN